MAVWEEIRHQVAIAGRVTEGQTGRAVPGAQVAITSAPAAFTDWLALRALAHGDRWATLRKRPDRTYTAVNGHFHFLDLPAGQYTLTVALAGAGRRYGTTQTTVTVAYDNTGKVTMAVANLTLPPTTVTGRISNQADGVGVPLAAVRVGGSGEQTTSDLQGNYRLTALETGQRTLVVTAQGFQPATQTVTLTQAGVVQTVNLALNK